MKTGLNDTVDQVQYVPLFCRKGSSIAHKNRPKKVGDDCGFRRRILPGLEYNTNAMLPCCLRSNLHKKKQS